MLIMNPRFHTGVNKVMPIDHCNQSDTLTKRWPRSSSSITGIRVRAFSVKKPTSISIAPVFPSKPFTLIVLITQYLAFYSTVSELHFIYTISICSPMIAVFDAVWI